ncbi:adenylate/guanylate cyclase domain-containing protein [Xenophilus sp. Marseille-Q4582]|uniref:adenylate/guanylate cyclase domain-containing protein n=1 Tax=Xenophilus sp. Marseille-Q4582 TaxID=2866600 RepID=UPI001CE3DE81|nr:adenylate/guanylate cyclase domain-containing protein [Xenophilus sp. Marseille-Q4582]
MSTPSAALPRPARLRRFRVDVGTILATLVLTQSALLVGAGYWGAQRLVSTIGESTHHADHQRVEDRIQGFLRRTASAVDALAGAPRLSPTGPEAAASAELMWTLLMQAPELDSLYVADDAGHMLLVGRKPAPGVRFIAHQGGVTRETWEYKPPFDNPDASPQARFATQSVATFQTSYDPQSRPWYRQAVAAQQPIWTEPYVYTNPPDLGVTYAVPGRREDGDGPLRISVGDVTLSRLGDFVRQFSRAGYGDSALLTASHQVLARSDLREQPGMLAEPMGGVLGAVHLHLRASGLSPEEAARPAFRLEVEGVPYLVRLSRIPSTQWELVSWVPEEALMGGLHRALLWALALVAAFLALILVYSLRLAQRVTRPVEQLSGIARRIGRLELDHLPRVNSRVLELQHLDQALDDSARGLRAFRRFVPVDVVRQLLAEGRPLEPSGEPREVTVMFTDIHGFTALAESTPPDLLVEQLTQYFNLASEVIVRHGGTIDKFMGDGMMVLWGAPTELPDAALQASHAALALLAAIDALNAEWGARGLSPFDTRIGIHTGPVVAGVLGAHDRLAYTAVGDTVNVASRIEGINRELGTRALVSETTAQALDGRLPTRRIDAVELRGRQRPLMVYELLRAHER